MRYPELSKMPWTAQGIYRDRTSFELQELINTFEFLTRLKVCILFRDHYEPEQTHRDKSFLERIGHFNDFCTIVKSSRNVRGCGAYDGVQRAHKAEQMRRPFIDECPSGVIELVVPFIVRGQLIATLFCGAIRKYADKEKSFEYTWDKVSYRGINREKLKKAYDEFMYVPRARLLRFGNLFFSALSHIGNYLDDGVIEEKIELQKQPLIAKAVALIHGSKEDFPNAAKLAEYLQVTPQYFSRLFKKTMNKNFIDYLVEMRILRAQELLTNTKLPIIDIAFEVGYQRQSYFTKRFKQITGITPSKFRAASNILQ